MVPARHDPRLDLLGVAGRERECVDRAFRGCRRRTPGTGPSSATSSAAVARWSATGPAANSPRDFEDRRQVGVAAGAFGLGERAVRDLADQLGLEVELVAVEDEQVALGEPFEQAGRVFAARERERGGDRARCRRRPRSPRAAIVRPARARRAGPRRGRAASRGDPRRPAVTRAGPARSDVLDVRDELFDEERVAAAAFEQRRRRSRRRRSLSNSACDELRGRRAVERIEVEHERVVAPGGLGRPALVEARPGGREQHEAARCAAARAAGRRARARVLRPSAGRRAPSTSGVRALNASRNASAARMPSSRPRVGSTPGRASSFHDVHEPFDEPVGLRLSSPPASRDVAGWLDRDSSVGPRRRLRRRRALDAARVAERFGDRAERVRVAVRHALAEEHARAELFARDVGDLVRQAALADAGVAVEQHELRRGCGRSAICMHVPQQRPSRRRGRPSALGPGARRPPGRCEHAHGAVRLDGFVAAADAQQAERFVRDAFAGGGVRVRRRR